jgi:hypothetical protein
MCLPRRPGERDEVPGGRVVARRVQPFRICEVGVLEAEQARLAVHTGNEGRDVPVRRRCRKRDGRIVRALDERGGEQVADCETLPGPQEDARASDSHGRWMDSDHATGTAGVESDERGHELGDARHPEPLASVPRIDDLSRSRRDKHRVGVDGRRRPERGGGASGSEEREQRSDHERADAAPHLVEGSREYDGNRV